MRIPIIGLLALLIIGIAKADADNPDKSSRDSSKNLLSTLQKMHSSINAQIVELEHTGTIENSEKIHLLQHYTAQKDNIEREIAVIQSIEASHTAVAAPRHILKNLSAEEKIVPSLLNIFKKPKNPDPEQSNGNTGYSLSYSSHYPDYGQQYPYPYYGQATKPDYPYPNDLVQGTFPGYDPPNSNSNQQTFLNREQPLQSYQTPPAEQVSLQVPQQYAPPPQIMLQPLAQPPQPDPQRTQYQPQPQLEPYRPQPDPQRTQYQPQPQQEPYRPQPDPQRTQYQPQPQLEPYRPQPDPQRTQYQPQPQLEPYRPQPQPQPEPLLRPKPDQNKPPLEPQPDVNGQILQQSPFSQKPGVFVYYPNGVIDDEEQDRPTIVDRVGQAFDRVGQVISNLTNRQTLKGAVSRNEVAATKRDSERNGVTNNRPRSSTNGEKLKAKPMMSRDKAMMTKDKPKMRWVSV